MNALLFEEVLCCILIPNSGSILSCEHSAVDCLPRLSFCSTWSDSSSRLIGISLSRKKLLNGNTFITNICIRVLFSLLLVFHCFRSRFHFAGMSLICSFSRFYTIVNWLSSRFWRLEQDILRVTLEFGDMLYNLLTAARLKAAGTCLSLPLLLCFC